MPATTGAGHPQSLAMMHPLDTTPASYTPGTALSKAQSLTMLPPLDPPNPSNSSGLADGSSGFPSFPSAFSSHDCPSNGCGYQYSPLLEDLGDGGLLGGGPLGGAYNHNAPRQAGILLTFYTHTHTPLSLHLVIKLPH